MVDRKPNFFIVGAPKCGTTALYEYLNTHPNIFLPKVKEPYYFYTHKDKMRYAMHSMEEYLKLYEPAPGIITSFGDASVFYLMDHPSHQRIKAFNSEARIIVMVRNPLDMAYALHSQYIFEGWEDVHDFETAWRLQIARESGDGIPKPCPDRSLLQYRNVCLNGLHISKLLETFPTERVLVVVFDDFISDTLAVYKKVLDFMGEPFDGRTSFPPVNESRFWKHQSLLTILETVKGPWMKIKQMAGIQETGAWAFIKSIMTEKRARKKLPREFREVLLAEFSADISKLENITRRDLSTWKKIN